MATRTRIRSDRRRSSVALLTVLLLVLSACGNGDDDPEGAADGGSDADAGDGGFADGEDITLRVSWWGADERHNATIAAIESFEESYPNVTVEPEFSGFDGYNDRLATQAAGGNAPDVFQVDPSAVTQYARSGVLLDLDDHVGSELSLDDFAENVRDLGRTTDGLVALPWGLTAPILTVREDLFQDTDGPQEDMSWEDYEQWALDVYEQSGNEVHGTQDMGYMDDALRVWLRQRDLSLYTEEGQLGFEQADLVEYFEMWDRMRESGAAPPAEISAEWDGTPENSNLANGFVAAEFGYTSVQSGVAGVAGVPVESRRLPGNSETPGDYLRTSVYVSAYADSENPDAAAAFIDYMVNDEDAGEALGASRGVPPNQQIQEAIRPDASEDVLAELDYIAEVEDSVGPPPPLAPPGAFEVLSTLRRVYEQIAFGALTPQEGAEQFFSETQATLDAAA